MESVRVEDTFNFKAYDFVVKQWFDLKSGDKKIEREITSDTKPGEGILSYKISVKTMNLRGAGTDANVPHQHLWRE